MKCGLLGRVLGHSYSPWIHAQLGDYDYRLIEVEPDDLGDFLLKGDFSGLNVTIPYKKAVIPYLDELTPTAQKLGAVNTIVRREGRLIGHNTDYFGFLTMIDRLGLDPAGKKCLVLGSGGASNTAVAVLQERGGEVIVISRTGISNYSNLSDNADAAILVNTTPVGMYPNAGVSPVDLNAFPQLEYVLDVVYNPLRTQLLMDAEKRGISCGTGLLMLVAQAKEAAEWFTDSSISDEKIDTIHRYLRRQTENVILIGMPGCGKSTVGRALAERLDKPFVDTDAWIEEKLGKPVPDIIRHSGIEAFRIPELQAMKHLGKESGLVIATGGGCVTKPENYDPLHQNGTIIWLQRDLDKLPTEGRPLSQAGKPEEMYAARRPMYEAFADYAVDNNNDLESTISQILEVLP